MTTSQHMAAAHFKTMVEVVHHCHTLGVIHRCAVCTLLLAASAALDAKRMHYATQIHLPADPSRLRLSSRC